MTFEARTGETLISAPDRWSADGAEATARRPEGPGPILVIMHGEASSAGRIGQWLIRRGHALDIRKPRFGDPLPDTLDGHAGVVVFGGPMSCNDPDDYLKHEIDFVGRTLAARKPYLGICLGGQMLAKYLGATVGKHPFGKVEIGYHPLNATAAGQAFGPWPSWVYQWHREGFELPSGCTKLAEGAVFENQAFSTCSTAVGLQFHPEITYALVNRWTVNAKDWKDRDGAQERHTQLSRHLLNSGRVSDWLGRMLDGWLGARVPAE